MKVTRKEIVRAMEGAMIAQGHNAPWWRRASYALDAIYYTGAAIVDREELELLKKVYGFSLPDIAEPQKDL